MDTPVASKPALFFVGDCTYNTQYAGEVEINQLVGISHFVRFERWLEDGRKRVCFFSVQPCSIPEG